MSSNLLIADAPITIQLPISDSFEVETEQILPNLIIWIYIAVIVVFGILVNSITFGALVKAKCNGTSIFIIQMILTDLTSLAVATIEVIYMNNRKWIFHTALCPVYLGLESISSTASIYFIIAVNLHAISTYNLALKSENRKPKLQSFRRSSDSHQFESDSYELSMCTQQRSLTIDYSRKKKRISVMCPILFIWFLSMSVSIPLITFGVVLPNTKSAFICGMGNFNQGTNLLLQLLVLFIRIIVPSLCLMLSLLYVGYKYLFSKSDQMSRLNKDAYVALKLGFVLSIVFILFCTQRMYCSLMFEIMTKPFMQYKYPVFDKMFGVVFCMINYTISAIRPLIYLYVDNNNLRTKMKYGCKKQSSIT